MQKRTFAILLLATGLLLGASEPPTTEPATQPTSQPATNKALQLPEIKDWVFTWQIYKDEGVTIQLQRTPEGDIFLLSGSYRNIRILPRDVDAIGRLMITSKDQCERQKRLAKDAKSEYQPAVDARKVGASTVTFTATKSGRSEVSLDGVRFTAASAEDVGTFLKDASKYVASLDRKFKLQK